MQVLIKIPEKEFGVDIADKFQDFFKRLRAETENHLKSHTNLVCGNYELETIEMFLNAFKEMQIIEHIILTILCTAIYMAVFRE